MATGRTLGGRNVIGGAPTDARNTMDSFPNQGDWDLTVAVGPARNGVTMLEVGFDLDETGRQILIHAMNARRKYLRGGVI